MPKIKIRVTVYSDRTILVDALSEGTHVAVAYDPDGPGDSYTDSYVVEVES